MPVVAQFRLVVPGPPVPWARAGRAGGRSYTPRRQSAHMETVRQAWLAAGRPTLGAARIALSARFYRAPGGRPGDLDNYLKLVKDALTGLAYHDDVQIDCYSGCHRLPADAQGPRTELDFWAHP